MRCIVHVGDMKCGSKAIQHWLCRNEQQLRDRGFFVSQELRAGCYHSFLSSYALDDHRSRNTARRECHVRHARQVPAHRADVRERLSREIAGLPADGHTVIFSHEQLLSLRPREVARAIDLLRQHFSDVQVVAYIRRQDRHFVSAWGQRLKTGIPHSRFFGRLRRKWSYLRMLETWEGHVGHEAMSVRLFDEGFDEYPEQGSPQLCAKEALEIAGAVLECFVGVPSAELVSEAYETVLGRSPTSTEVSSHMASAHTISDVYRLLLTEAGVGQRHTAVRAAA